MLKVGTKIKYKKLDGEIFYGTIVQSEVFQKDAYFYEIQDAAGKKVKFFFYQKGIDDAIKNGEIEIVGNGLQKMKKRLKEKCAIDKKCSIIRV